ncbi:MAG: 2-C-methyl-D-erythritol 4-phosphate cytidylyltransferase [Paludibacteraceae bacterium]|nr:2-C-methyl-D-erythritol 4-phosphate cytidylyltransferase [Paludibacteraceae bacterium]
MKNIAIILAGGTGSRVGGETPKQLLPLADGRSILEHSIDAFEDAPSIDEVAVVMHPSYINTLQELCQNNHWQKLKMIIPGGGERWESSYNAVTAYRNNTPSLQERHGETVSLLFHDAARPFVSQRIISEVCTALEKHEAVTVAVPSTDTIYITENNRLIDMPPRETVWRAQTPQAFHLETIAEAFRKAVEQGNIAATDDIGILHHYSPEIPVYIVPGEEQNRKITYREDL